MNIALPWQAGEQVHIGFFGRLVCADRQPEILEASSVDALNAP